jgi:hypothetical protein
MVRGIICAVAIAAALVGAGRVSAAPSPALPAQVVEIQRPVSPATFQTAQYKSDGRPAKTGKTTWRVVQGTGNCCENYLTVTKQGRLLDFGGSFIRYTDDRGLTWNQVQPLTPLVNGEGSIALAPNGDVIAIGWDPYSGDHLQSYKYDALSQSWYYLEMPLHQPFYDREWVAVLPGPFSIDGRTYPYISIVKGGVPKDPAYYSVDGLDYTNATSQFLDEQQTTPVSSWLTAKADSSFDWIQPNSNGGMTPLGGGGALAVGDITTDWGLFNGATRTWSAFTYPGGAQPSGSYQVDSLGRLHNLVPHSDGFDYMISADGGLTWRVLSLSLPAGFSLDQIDFRANRAAGIAAVAVHALNNATANDQDWAYTIDITRNTPVLKRRYTVGLGDTGSMAGVGNTIRMDFQTVAIFADGRIALSFLDSTTHYPSPTTGQEQARPALAIEQTTTMP